MSKYAETPAKLWRKPEAFVVTLHIFAQEDRLIPAAGILDTGCEKGNWISKRKVKEMGMESAISSHPECVVLKDFNGQPVVSCGTIELVWKRHTKEARTYKSTFYVHPTSDHFDAVLGAECIKSEGLFEVVEPVVFSGTPVRHIKGTQEEKEEIKRLEEEQRKINDELAAKRAAEEAAKRAAEEEAKRAA